MATLTKAAIISDDYIIFHEAALVVIRLLIILPFH